MISKQNSLFNRKILTANDSLIAARNAELIAREMGFGSISSKEVSLAVSEICTNVVRFAESGEIDLTTPVDGAGIRVIITDKGPGIPDTDKAMEDGYTTVVKSLGVGLGAAKRAMDIFLLQSSPDKGTIVDMTKFKGYSPDIQLALKTLPDDGYPVNGDSCFVTDIKGDRILFAVIDGLGQGASAQRSAIYMNNFISRHRLLPLEELIYKLDESLKISGYDGGSLNLLIIKDREMEYIGIGDTWATIYAEKPIHFNNQKGIIGQFHLPKLKSQKATLPPGPFIIAMCTDGIRNKFNFLAQDVPQSAEYIAAQIMQGFRRDHGDATVLIIKGENHA